MSTVLQCVYTKEIAKDKAGNLLLSKGGSLVLRVLPYSVDILFAPGNWDFSRIRVVTSYSTKTFSANLLDEQVQKYRNTEYVVSTYSGRFTVEGNAGNVQSKGDRYSMTIYGAIQPNYIDGYDVQAPEVSINADWGLQTIHLDKVFVCTELKKLVTIDVDFDIITMTVHKGNAASETFVCEGSDIEMTVTAPYVWCMDGGVGANEYFTESEIPNIDSRIWASYQTTVFVESDETEDEALDAACHAKVVSVDSRVYFEHFSADESDEESERVRYWRDETLDVVIGDTYKSRMELHPAVLVGQDDVYNDYQFCKKDLWCENVINGAWTADTTGRLFSKAYYEGGDPQIDKLMEYSTERCQLNVDPRNVMTFADAGIEYTYLARISEDSNARYTYGYMLKTGNTTTLPENPHMGVDSPVTYCEYVTFDGAKKCWLRKDYTPGPSEREIAAFPSKPYWEEVADGVFELKPDTHDEVGQIFSLRKLTGYCFKWTDGRYYYTARPSWNSGLIGYVYEFDTLKAWSTTPCADVITVYTDNELLALGDVFYTYNTETKEKLEAGQVHQTGNAVYSITDNKGYVYHFKEYRHPETDEEFE